MMTDPFTTVVDFGFRCKNNDNINLIFTLWKIDDYKGYTYKTLFGYQLKFHNFIKEFTRWNRVTKKKMGERAKWKLYSYFA